LVSILTAPTKLIYSAAFVFAFDTISPFEPIESIHRKLFNPSRTMFNRVALLAVYVELVLRHSIGVRIEGIRIEVGRSRGDLGRLARVIIANSDF
jgi:hypothetical protein